MKLKLVPTHVINSPISNIILMELQIVAPQAAATPIKDASLSCKIKQNRL